MSNFISPLPLPDIARIHTPGGPRRPGARRLRRVVPFIAAVLIMAVSTTQESFAVELGLTPSHVVSLWTNTNNALVALARISSKNSDLAKRVDTTTTRSFSGKKPADVLKRVEEFRGKLDRLRSESNLPTTRRRDNDGGVVTPSLVFLNSGYVLDATVDWIIRNSSRKQLVSQFYVRHDIAGKTPSDAFSFVDLANRRLDMILSAF